MTCIPSELVPRVGKFYTIEEINEEADTVLVNVPSLIRIQIVAGHFVDLPPGQYQLNLLLFGIPYIQQNGGSWVEPEPPNPPNANTVYYKPNQASFGKLFKTFAEAVGYNAPPGMEWVVSQQNPFMGPRLQPICPDPALKLFGEPGTTPATGYHALPTDFGRYYGDISAARIGAAAQVEDDAAEQLFFETAPDYPNDPLEPPEILPNRQG